MRRLFVAAAVAGLGGVVGGTPVLAGPGWSIMTTANTTGARSILHAVSCTSAKACTAVGYAGAGVGTGGSLRTLAERWNGSSWVIQATPNPAGMPYSFLYGVSCAAAKACVAVGESFDSTGNNQALAERWNGTRWRIKATPTPGGGKDANLTGVSCTSATACIAVGNYIAGTTGLTLAERWDGTAWTVQPTPNPSGSTGSLLSEVSCVTATVCVAVGISTDSSSTQTTLAERWNGTTWSIDSTPNPSGSNGTQLIGVWCTSVSACSAVGNWGVGTTEFTLAERWDGATWTIESTPNPVGGKFPNLTGVSCGAPTACTAVGNYIDSTNTNVTLAEHWDGTVWAIQTTPNPSTAAGSLLSRVACTAATGCTAAGFYFNSAGTYLTLVERSS